MTLRWFLLALLILACWVAQEVFAAPHTGIASFYGLETCRYNRDPQCPTASGRSLYDLVANYEPYCASWGYKFGTKLRLTNLVNGREAGCVVWDRGPHQKLNRIVDLSPLVFAQLADLEYGVITVRVDMEALP